MNQKRRQNQFSANAKSLFLGSDIVEVSRIEKSIQSSRFLKKIFSEEEVNYCRSKVRAAEHFAVRFAAKEAVWKALSGCVKNSGIGHREISVSRLKNGQPIVKLSKRLRHLEPAIKLTLSHTRTLALAVAIIQI